MHASPRGRNSQGSEEHFPPAASLYHLDTMMTCEDLRELRRWRLINRRRRVGVMGGTFDPVHHGHLVAGSEVAHIFDLDEVVFVPTGQPYQKNDRKVSSAEDRYLMTVIAT